MQPQDTEHKELHQPVDWIANTSSRKHVWLRNSDSEQGSLPSLPNYRLSQVSSLAVRVLRGDVESVRNA